MTKEEYQKNVVRRNTIIVISCVVLLLTALAVSINAGYTKLTIGETVRVLIGQGTKSQNTILFTFRLPRIFVGILVGIGLAISGTILQCLSKNELADPGILGINSGASLTVIISIMLWGQSGLSSKVSLPFISILGAGFATVLVVLFSYKKDKGIIPERLVLVGVAIQAGITAVTTVLVVRLDETQFEFLAAWQAGNIWGSTWTHVLIALPWIIIFSIWAFTKAKTLDILSLGDEISTGLGVEVKKEQIKLLTIAIVLAAVSVSISGNIGFVGLVTPHIARQLVGSRHKQVIPVAAMLGAVFVCVSDTMARTLFQPSELPAGIIMAAIGAPYFIYLLAKSK